MAFHNIRRIDYLHLDPVLDDHNDGNLGVVTDDNENGEVTLLNVIQLKRVGRRLEPGYKPVYHFQIRSK